LLKFKSAAIKKFTQDGRNGRKHINYLI
jgi:hypothetical protein